MPVIYTALNPYNGLIYWALYPFEFKDGGNPCKVILCNCHNKYSASSFGNNWFNGPNQITLEEALDWLLEGEYK